MNWTIDTSDPRIRIIQEKPMAEPKEWTIERVKAELPLVDVTMPTGVKVTATITGSKARFATLRAKSNEWGIWVTLGECDWLTLAHCLNTNRPVSM